MTKVKRMRALEWIMLIGLSLLWGGSFFFSEIALREVSPLVTVWARVGLACGLLWLILWLRGIAMSYDTKLWLAFGVMGLLNNAIPFSLIVWGQQNITASLASIFNASTPLFTAVLAHFLTQDEKIGRRKIAGLAIGFCGVVMMIGTQALHGVTSELWAQIAILIAAISYGCAAIWGRRFKGTSPMVVATGQVTASSLMMTPVALLFGFPTGYLMPSIEVWGALFGLAALCSVAAYILYFRILATSGATNLMLVTFLIPPSAILLGVLFLGEHLQTSQIIGMSLIFVGLAVMDGRLLQRRWPNPWQSRKKLRG